LRRIFNIDPAQTEKIGGPTYNMSEGRMFSTLTHATREESLAAEAGDDATTKIYTDGSGFQGGAGAAAVIYLNGSPNPSGALRFHLGKLTEHSTYEGEVVGLMLAVWLMRTHCKEKIGKEGISIYTDCQSMIDTIYDMKPGPGQYLLNEFHKLISPFEDKGHQVCKFTINWIFAHSNVTGNERVDEEAKQAAKGNSTPRIFLPPLLQRPLPISKSALIQEAKLARAMEWKTHWETSPQVKKMKDINKDFPYKKFGQLEANLTRRQTSILV